MQEGMEKGLAEGNLEGRKEVAKKLLDSGMSKQEVANLTELSLEEIENL